jgi:hypothetical protein
MYNMVHSLLSFILEFIEGFTCTMIIGTLLIYAFRLLQLRKKDVWNIKLKEGKGIKINLRQLDHHE